MASHSLSASDRLIDSIHAALDQLAAPCGCPESSNTTACHQDADANSCARTASDRAIDSSINAALDELEASRACPSNTTTSQAPCNQPDNNAAHDAISCCRTDHAKTLDSLAHRAISLRSVVKFMQELYTRMPHFDPHRSTTTDVVRFVIIPATRALGCSYAELVNQQARLLPQRMYTHAWGARFADTMAAVFADALGLSSYWQVKHLLHPDKLGLLEATLADKGALDSTIWMCIFGVNQHVSICDATFGDKDTVTGDLATACDCGLPKYSCGELCEMNKFDDMLVIFQQSSPGYYHRVCCGESFLLLSRIWVIAEIAEAYRLGIPVGFVVHSPQVLVAREYAAAIDVNQAQASRPEDVEFILGKIEDKAAFNTRVQCVVVTCLYSTAAASTFHAAAKKFITQPTEPGTPEFQIENTLCAYGRSKQMDVCLTELVEPFVAEWSDQLKLCSSIQALEAYWAASPCSDERVLLANWSMEGVADLFLQRCDRAGYEAYARIVGSSDTFSTALIKRRGELGLQVPVTGSGRATAREWLAHRPTFVTFVQVRGPDSLLCALGGACQSIFEQIPDGPFVSERPVCTSGVTGGEGLLGVSIVYMWIEAADELELVLHRGVDEVQPCTGLNESLLDSDNAAKLVQEFIISHAVPRFGQFHEANRVLYRNQASRGFIVVCFDPELGVHEQAKKHKQALKGVSEAVASGFVCGFFNFEDALVPANLENAYVDRHPSVVLLLGDFTAGQCSGATGQRFVRSFNDQQIATDAILEFLHSAMCGDIDDWEPVCLDWASNNPWL